MIESEAADQTLTGHFGSVVRILARGIKALLPKRDVRKVLA